jgi:MoxR-like ATPase
MSTPAPTAGTADGMIEFPCYGCGRALKVPGSAAGKQAKCPQCNAVQMVPQTGTSPAIAGMQTMQPSPPMSFAPDAPQEAPSEEAAKPQASGFAQTVTVSAPHMPETKVHEGRDTPTRRLFDRMTEEIAKIYVGQDELVLGALTALFSSGHVLIESVPGLGKTLFVRTLGRVLGLKFGRIQFTADLMPSDITGAPIFDLKQQEFRFRPGPVFTQVLLADEINRSPAKTHAALLEIMQEYRVTIDGVSHPIQRPFLVLATQNPIESEGTYNLPEAQLDRFMFKLVANYPSESEESNILKLHSQQTDINDRLEHELQTVTSPEEISATILTNSQVRVDEKLVDYINKLVRRTRAWPQFYMGASPRAGIALRQAARTLAAFHGRDYAVPDDVVQIALPSLRHRVSMTAEAEVEGHKVDSLLTELIRSVEVPRL